MHLFIHIITDSERIRDPDGEEFADLEAARAEASQSARDLMAGELMAGRPVPFGWRAQLADDEGSVLLTIPFAGLVFGSDDPSFSLHSFRPVVDQGLTERTRALIAHTRRHNNDIKHNIAELRSHLRTLAGTNKALGKVDGSR